MATSQRRITHQELAAHNCEETGVWVSMHDKVYDITKFLNSHPGGKEYLLLAAGRDITDLFISYHPFSEKPEKVLQAYEIGVLVSRQYPRFKPDTGFYKTVRERVGAYFKDNKIHYKEPSTAIIKMSMMLCIYTFAFIIMCTPYIDSIITQYIGLDLLSVTYDRYSDIDGSLIIPSTIAVYIWWFMHIIASVTIGWSQMMFLLHIMHDSSHSAFGPSEVWWKIGGRIFSETIVGSNMTCWQNQHVIGHHIYTSIYSVDPDVPVVPDNDIRLILPHQRNKWYYKYQHIYLLFLYTLLAFKTRIQDLVIFYIRFDGPIAVNPISPIEWARNVGAKVIHFAVRCGIPLLYMSFSKMFILYCIAEMVGGAYLAFNFQVSHVSHYATIPVAKAIPASQSFPVNSHIANDPHNVLKYDVQKTEFDKDIKASNEQSRSLRGVEEASQDELIWDLEWSHLQLATSVDYAYDSPLCTFMTGALNYQTIHHLFPSVSQYHYPAIAPIVRKVCDEYGLHFNYVAAFKDAVAGHFDYLKMMAEKGKLDLTIPSMD